MAVATLWAVSTHFAAAAPARNVLVLYSNSRLVKGNAEVDRGLHEAIPDAAAPPIHLFYEYLDFPEFGGEAHERAVLAYLRAKYESHAPAVLVSFSDAAFEFLVRHRDALFPGVPLVYASVAPSVLKRYPPADDVVGIAVEYDFAGTIAQALRWHPRAQRLVVITGTSARDHEWEERLRREAPPLAGARTVEFWSGLPTAELLDRLARLDSGSVVFTPGFYADGAGASTNPAESGARIARASGAPVYGPLDTFIGAGVVGGRMPSFERIGRQAGEIVQQVLSGTPPATLRPARAATVLNVDWRQVQRFGIRESDIPADAVVHFRPPTYWQQYRRFTIGAASIILLQAGLIAALLFERRRRRSAELTAQKHRIELAHAARLAVTGELTASIAHEINQPLAAVQTSADAADLLLQSDQDSRDDLRRIVARIRHDSVRASDVIRRLRSLLARHAPERKPFDFSAAVDDVTRIMDTEARRRGVTLQVCIGAPGARVLGDETQLQQVLINLVINSMDAVADMAPERRTIEIATALSEERLCVTVRDRGTGIGPEDESRVFDSFYTTKAKGMGLGLAIARSIVEAHGGRIYVRRDVETGAAFCFELPLYAESACAPAGAEASVA